VEKATLAGVSKDSKGVALAEAVHADSVMPEWELRQRDRSTPGVVQKDLSTLLEARQS